LVTAWSAYPDVASPSSDRVVGLGGEGARGGAIINDVVDMDKPRLRNDVEHLAIVAPVLAVSTIVGWVETRPA
jgi:hypothetical protein